MFAAIEAATVLGANGRRVTVEVHVGDGLPGFTIVGQPDTTCREARDRVRAALLSAGLSWPLQRVTVNLAPAGVRKAGAALDLPIAIGMLVALGQLPPERVENKAFLGELGLDGSLRSFPGCLAHADAITAKEIVVPHACVRAAKILGRHHIHGVRHLSEVLEALQGTWPWPDEEPDEQIVDSTPTLDLSDVRGQPFARQALEVAAAGGHHLLLIGPPGAGKTMLAERLPGIMPELTREQAIEVLRIHSAAGLDTSVEELPTIAPIRSPHHTASTVSLLGGGSAWLRPGEISCAHHGVLFLDELGEFPQTLLDALRQPLERGVIAVDRAAASVLFPARFLLIAATNPCPCGWRGNASLFEKSQQPECRCTAAARARYARRLSGPFLDRFDLRVEVERPDPEQLLGTELGESSSAVRNRVFAARSIAVERQGYANGRLAAGRLDEVARLSAVTRSFLDRELRSGAITARGVARVRRVARTIADLADQQNNASSPVLPDECVFLALELRRRTAFEEAVA